MTDAAPESRNQLITALAIVGAMTLLGAGLLVYGWAAHDSTAATGGVFTIIGALATALNAPSGISKVLAAAKADPNPTQPLPGAEPKVP